MAFGDSAVARIIWEPFKNTSGQVIPASAAMHHNGDVERGGNFVMQMEQPSSTFRRIVYINGPVDVPIGGYGSCTRYAAYALCDSGNTPAQDEEWGPKPSSWKLWKGYLGATILGGETGSGDDQRAKVVLSPANELFGTLDGSLSQGGSATMSVFAYAGSWTDTTWDVTVYDRLLKSGATAISSGKWVVARWYSGRWWAEAAECN